MSLSAVSTFGEGLAGVVVGQQLMLSLKMESKVSEDYVAIVEIRKKDGVTADIISKGGQLEAGVPAELRIQWTALESGDLYARAFVIGSFESPEVLSEVMQTRITAVTSLAELEALTPVSVELPPPGSQQDGDGDNNNNSSIIPTGEPAPYTLMVYMVASNLESSGYYATLDVMEMMSVGSTENVNVIVQTGGSANSTVDDFRFIDFTQVQRHEILKNDIKTVENLGKKNMGSSSTLRDFVSWGIEKYPAEKYAIILWDHGAGMMGFGYDDIYQDMLDLNELRDGLYPSAQQGKKFELVGFDACLMASLEVANALTGRGEYLVASEELEPAWGMDFAAIVAFIDEHPGQGGLELGRAISDSYLAHARENGRQYKDYRGDKVLTMSVIDLDKIPSLFKDVSSVGEYFDRLGGDMDVTHALTKTIRETERYGESGKSSTGHLDLYHLAENVDKEFPAAAGIGSNVKTGVDSAVVYKVGGDARQDSHGISIFMQVEEYEGNAPYLNYIVGRWIGVLTTARQTLEKDTTPPDMSLTMRRDNVVFGKIEGDDISYVSTLVSQDVEDNRYSLELMSIVDEEPSDFIKPDDHGFISYNWSRTIMSMCNGEDTNCSPTSLTYEKNGSTKFAYTQVRLESDHYNGTLVLIYTADSDRFQFLGGWPGVDENGNAQRELVPIVPGDRVFTYTYILRYSPSDDEVHFDKMEAKSPIIVGEGFGPAYHRYPGEYKVVLSACDFADNCGYTSDYAFRVE